MKKNTIFSVFIVVKYNCQKNVFKVTWPTQDFLLRNTRLHIFFISRIFCFSVPLRNFVPIYDPKSRIVALVENLFVSVSDSGRCFGELSVIEKRDRNATVISDEPCVLVKFDDKVYDKHINTGAAEDLLRRSNFVGNHPLFQTLLPYRDLIVENLKLRHYKFNDEIFRQGNVCIFYFYFLACPQVKIIKNYPMWCRINLFAKIHFKCLYNSSCFLFKN